MEPWRGWNNNRRALDPSGPLPSMPSRNKTAEGKSGGGVSKSSSRKTVNDGLGGWDDDDE